MYNQLIVGFALALRTEGKSARKIQKRLKRHFDVDVALETLRTWFKRVGRRQRIKIRQPTKQVRVKKINKKTINKIYKYLKKKRGNLMVTIAHLIKYFKLDCAQITMIRALDSIGVKCFRRRGKTYPSVPDFARRMRFAKKIQRMTKIQLRDLVSADGATVYAPKSKRQMRDKARAALGPWVWRTRRDGLDPTCVGASSFANSQGGSIKIWGVTGYSTRTKSTHVRIATLPPKDRKRQRVMVTSKNGKKYPRMFKNDDSVSMNSSRWMAFLEKHIKPWCLEMGFDFKNRIPTLVLDGEKALHTKPARKALRRLGFKVLKVPPSSPDLNPIENVWSMMKRHVFKTETFPSRIEQRNFWVRKIHDSARGVQRKQNLCDTVRLSWKQRAADVIAMKGARTKW